MAELQDVMAVAFREVGAWSTPPLFHGVNPIFTQADAGRSNSPVCVPVSRPGTRGPLPSKPVFGPDTVFTPGMTCISSPTGRRDRTPYSWERPCS